MSVSIMHNGYYVCEAEPMIGLDILENDREKLAAHMADQKRHGKQITERLVMMRQAVKHVHKEMYAEAIDEQRDKLANVVSMDARRAKRTRSPRRLPGGRRPPAQAKTPYAT